MNSAEAWNYAIGMIIINGLEPTKDITILFGFSGYTSI